MNSRRFYILILPAVLCFAFADENPFLKIEAKDLQINVPASFPKPIYDFKNNKPTPAGFTLGRRLFYDPILSKDNSVSCSSCHERIAAFAHIDHKLSHGIYAKIGTRNVPPLQNLIWKDAFMWDGGVNHLEVQAINPITNPIEMDETLSGVLAKLKKDSLYAAMFREAYGDGTISSERLLKSLTQFTGLMVSSNSRYDQFVTGKDTFSAAEKNGLSIFRSNCAGCHREPLFTDNSYRNNGIGIDTSLRDKGRGMISGNEKDNYKFKVPSLRNIEMTYPYMHDGRFKKIRDVVEHYSSAKKHDPNADALLQKIAPMNEKEKANLVAFLLTLTDRKFLYDRRFVNPFFN